MSSAGSPKVVLSSLVLLGVTIGSGACVSDEIPPCPGQCFEFSIEYEVPKRCLTMMVEDIAIPFTAIDGYRGRHCFNSSSVAQVLEAIDHLRAGGLLGELPLPVRDAYVATVDEVREDLRAQCVLAAPGQCVNAEEVCAGIASDAYEQLVVDQSCVLTPDGIEPVALGPGQVCEAISLGEGTGTDGADDACTEDLGASEDGLEDTTGAGSDGADETGGSSTGGVLGPPGERVTASRCDGPSGCP